MPFLILLLIAIACSTGNKPADPLLAPYNGDLETGLSPDYHPGHSLQGEAFNEGPRRFAESIEGTGKVHFPITTKNPMAQHFFNQGVGQLHGFWSFEAERSFRQVLALDPNAVMAYWGMAMANTVFRAGNAENAKEFVRLAAARTDEVSPREAQWIRSLSRLYQEGVPVSAERRKDYAEDQEQIHRDYPDDLEATAFLALTLWENQHVYPKAKDSKPFSREAVDALLQSIFDVEPLHPAHHYRIHLWDGVDPSKALESARRCGQSAPAIAHMWHMPGHTYSQLKQFSDAAWHQEASARMDHRHMARFRVMPYQIHNYAHNNAWLVESLSLAGKRAAFDVAKNLIDLPLHPTKNPPHWAYSTAGKGQVALYYALENLDDWEGVEQLQQTPYLKPALSYQVEIQRQRLLALRALRHSDLPGIQAVLEEIRRLQPLALQAAATVEKQWIEPELEQTLHEVQAYELVAKGDGHNALTALSALGKRNSSVIEALFRIGNPGLAVRFAQEWADGARQRSIPAMATWVRALYRAGDTDQAREVFERLRHLAAESDLEVPVLRALGAFATQFGYQKDWRLPAGENPEQTGRPELASLGPLHWEPFDARPFSVQLPGNRSVSLSSFAGQPLLLVLYLGGDCWGCVSQLRKIEAQTGAFRKAGIQVMAVSIDSLAQVESLLEKFHSLYGRPFSFLMGSASDLSIFKAYHAYDDFEQRPLHGLYLIDAEGKVRWQDLGADAFDDVPFLLSESARLLRL